MTSFLASFLTTALVTPAVIVLAWRCGWVAKPRDDRWHSRTTALMGGIGIFIGTLVAWAWTGALTQLWALALPACGMFLLGAIDDRVVELRPHHKLIGQVLLAAGLIAAGIHWQGLPGIIALPLTLLWLVGITNAVNLLDNMDGLASGVTAISALVLAACCLEQGDSVTATAAFGLSGACAAFLLFNFNPARIFMGDCGSLFIGFSLAALAIRGSGDATPHPALSLLIPMLVLAVPIFDTTFVALARALNGRPIMPGFRDHSSHRMVLLGLSERGTVLVLYALSLLFGVLGLGVTYRPQLEMLLVAPVPVAGLSLLGLYLGLLKVYPEESHLSESRRRLLLRLHASKQTVQVILDLLLMPVAFVGAHLLRFEGELPAWVATGVLRALPFLLVARLLALSLARAYRGVWQYVGVVDLLRAVAGSTLGSVFTLLLLFLFTDLSMISRAALMIDWLLFTLFAVATRSGCVVLQHLFGTSLPRHAPRVLILGADADGVALVQKLRDPLSANRAHVVGVLDDDPEKQGRTLNGVPVLGPLASLPFMVRSGRANCCLLGVSAHSALGRQILELCDARQITVSHEPDALVPAERPLEARIHQPPVVSRQRDVVS
jgi:UDP-GlcNAc:undecaprenyl-phosphate GlcNAc-1-phosphate transferase